MMFFLSFFSSVWAEPCTTMEMFSHAQFREFFPPPPPSGEKESLDVYALPNSVFSDNFALRWGDNVSLSETDAEILLQEFERAWQHEIEDMGFPEPLGTDSHLFNVYIGNSGSGAPGSYGAAGYYSSDSSGWPMIVIDMHALEASGSYGVIPHEFFHAVQHACDTYTYEGESAWYWESTAIWMENEVYPEDPVYSAYLFGFAFFPHKALYYFNYPDTGALDEYYQYGAFVFPKFLSTVRATPFDVRDSWVLSVYGETPLEWWEDFFSTNIFADVVFDFALRNTYWDYQHGDWYRYYLDYYSEYYPQEDKSITKKVHAQGEADWTSVSASLLPENFGVNYIRLEQPAYASMEVGIDGSSVGEQGTSVSWRVGLVRKTEQGISYQELDANSPEQIHDLQAEEELTLVVMPIAPDANWGEQFSYEYLFVGYSEEVPSEPEDAPKLGCSSTNRRYSSLWLFLLTLGLIRRYKSRELI